MFLHFPNINYNSILGNSVIWDKTILYTQVISEKRLQYQLTLL